MRLLLIGTLRLYGQLGGHDCGIEEECSDLAVVDGRSRILG